MTAPAAPRWPGGRSFCVVVTVDFDSELALTGPDPTLAPMQKTLSLFRYGARRGAPRLLDVFDGFATRATWFVPGALVGMEEALLRDVVARGHELGARGHRLERLDTLAPEKRAEVLADARTALRGVSASETCGFRLPSGEWPRGLGAQLLDAGFTWSSSWVGDDLPFFVPAGEGRALPELPVLHVLDDRLAFAWNFSPPIPPGHSRIPPYEEVLQSWLFELEGCVREGLFLVVQLHPEVTGTPGRIDLVRRLLDAVHAEPGAWVATGSEVASWWSSAHGPDPAHPVELLQRLSPSTLA